jgi:predicted nucleic acid-binding protein
VIENLDSMAIMVADLVPVEALPDPDDNWIIANAIAGEADMIVSGDKSDLLTLDSVQSIEIVTLRTALNLFS